MGRGGARGAFLPHVGHDTCCRADIERHANVHKTTVKSVSIGRGKHASCSLAPMGSKHGWPITLQHIHPGLLS